MPSTRCKRGNCSSTTCNKCDGINSEQVNVNVLNFSRHDAVQADNNHTKKHKLKSSDDIITCSLFGPDRYTKYPGYHVCTLCKHWDACPMENKQLNCNMKAYRCEINHHSYVTPAEKHKEWRPSRNIISTRSDTATSPDESSNRTTNTNATVSNKKKMSANKLTAFLQNKQQT